MPSANLCFLLLLYIRKVLKEIFSEMAQNSQRSVFTQNEDVARRRVREGPWGPQVGARRGPTLGYAWGSPGAPGTLSHRLFAYKLPFTLKITGTDKFSTKHT